VRSGSGRQSRSATHDRYFLDRVVDRIIEVDGGVRASDGGYSAWLERRAAATG
jgi:ATPase subunit of ABC transporter with duplicated ATPase domains